MTHTNIGQGQMQGLSVEQVNAHTSNTGKITSCSSSLTVEYL